MDHEELLKNAVSTVTTVKAFGVPVVHSVVDAIGGTSPEAHRAGLEPVMQAGARPTSWVSLACELQRGWARVERSPRSSRSSSPTACCRNEPTVDLHHHVIPDFYWEASNEDGNAAGGITPPRWSLDGAIAYLDEARIDVAVPSISTPGVHFGDDAAARALARRVNEYLAGIKRDRPDRFGAFAALPLPDVDGSLDQIAYALDVLELDGVSMMTNAGGGYLGDSRFEPIFAELQRRAAVVFVHPTASPDPVAHTLGLPDSLLDYPVDTSRAIAKLHYSNTFALHRYPPPPPLGHRLGVQRPGAPYVAIGHRPRKCGFGTDYPIPVTPSRSLA